MPLYLPIQHLLPETGHTHSHFFKLHSLCRQHDWRSLGLREAPVQPPLSVMQLKSHESKTGDKRDHKRTARGQKRPLSCRWGSLWGHQGRLFSHAVYRVTFRSFYALRNQRINDSGRNTGNWAPRLTCGEAQDDPSSTREERDRAEPMWCMHEAGETCDQWNQSHSFCKLC